MALISRVYRSIGAESWFAHSFANDWRFSDLAIQAFLEGRKTPISTICCPSTSPKLLQPDHPDTSV
jgi:hypothetical protein